MSKHTNDAAFLVKWVIIGALCIVVAMVLTQVLTQVLNRVL